MFFTRSLPIVLMYMIEEPSGHSTPRSLKNSFQSRLWLPSLSSSLLELRVTKPLDCISFISEEAVSMRSMKAATTG